MLRIKYSWGISTQLSIFVYISLKNIEVFKCYRCWNGIFGTECSTCLASCNESSGFICFVGVCGCCGALRPRYKRLVDNIFPEDSEVRSFCWSGCRTIPRHVDNILKNTICSILYSFIPLIKLYCTLNIKLIKLRRRLHTCSEVNPKLQYSFRHQTKNYSFWWHKKNCVRLWTFNSQHAVYELSNKPSVTSVAEGTVA